MRSSKDKNIPTIGIIGGTLWGNRGAEAMLVTTIGQIRERIPNAQFKVFSYYPHEDSNLCNDATIDFLDCRPLTLGLKTFPLAIIAGFFKAMKIRLSEKLISPEVAALRDCDVLLDIGGITFCDGREIFLPFNVLSILPAMLLNVPVIKLSQAMGSFRNPINRVVSKTILPACHRLFARGSITEKHLRELELAENIRDEASDIAFAYQPGFSLTSENENRVAETYAKICSARTGAAHSVSVIPSSLVYKKNPEYADAMASLIYDLLAANCHVSLLPNATKASSSKGRNNDLFVIRKIVEILAIRCADPELRRLTAVDFDVNTASIRRLMQQSDLIVTSRFHGMVAGLAGEIPTVVVGWSHKYGEVLHQFDCERFSFDHAAGDTDLSKSVFKLLLCTDDYRSKLAMHLPAVRRSAERQFEAIFDLLGLPPSEDNQAIIETAASNTATLSFPGFDANSSPVLQD